MSGATVYRFHGGIHPEQNKAQSLRLPLGQPPLPPELILPLNQHIGQPARPLVAVGDQVLKGQVIAINNGFVSSFLHAPSSGVIRAIESRPVAHPSGLTDTCIVIELDQQDTWCELQPMLEWQTSRRVDVLAYLAEMGIVGLGGAGFPTQVKLQGAQSHTLSHLIINAAECEPYITADDMLMQVKAEQLLAGIEILQHLVRAERIFIGIEDNKPKAIAALQQVLTAQKLAPTAIELVVVPTKYPSGGEKQLIQLLTGKEVPSGKLPIDVGILCQNVGTCVAIYEAIYQGRPLISRITTLTGAALKHPQNVEALIGTPVAHLLRYADVSQEQLQRLIMGGPMMGFTLENPLAPIVKTSNCILAATAAEFPTPPPEQACIRCGMCEQACPASLLPQQLLWFSKSQEYDKAEHYNLFDCIECGACSYVCPSTIPLVQYYRHSKSAIREAQSSQQKSEQAKQRFEARKARQAAEAAEKEAKRLARAKPTPKAEQTETSTSAPSAPTQASEPVHTADKKLKVDLAIARAAVKKLEKAISKAEELQSPELADLRQQFEQSQQRVAQLAASLATHTTDTPTATAKTAPVTAISDPLKQQKIAAALAKAQVLKLQKRLANEPENQVSLDAEIAIAMQLQQDAEAQLAQLMKTQEN